MSKILGKIKMLIIHSLFTAIIQLLGKFIHVFIPVVILD